MTVAQEDEVLPEAHVEGAAERPAGSVLDLDVPHLRVPVEKHREPGRQGPADAAPGRAELEQDEAGRAVDVLAARGLRLVAVLVLGGHRQTNGPRVRAQGDEGPARRLDTAGKTSTATDAWTHAFDTRSGRAVVMGPSGPQSNLRDRRAWRTRGSLVAILLRTEPCPTRAGLCRGRRPLYDLRLDRPEHGRLRFHARGRPRGGPAEGPHRRRDGLRLRGADRGAPLRPPAREPRPGAGRGS